MSKFCTKCNVELSIKSIKSECKSCRHKEACLRYTSNNKKKIETYQKEYREKYREICNQRARVSYWKKPEEYNRKSKLHYREVNGIPIDSTFKKRKNGEGNIDSQGYKTITKKGHPNQMDINGRIREHVFVMSEFLKRPLRKDESVHHKNGDRLDNRIENLELWSKGQPRGQRVEDKISFYIEFLEKYGYKVLKE